MSRKMKTEGSRTGKLSKRRKTNLILNSLIAIVLLLIVIVSVNIFFGDSQTGENNESPAEVKDDKADNRENAGSGTSVKPKEDQESVQPEEEENAEADDDSTEEEKIVTEGGSSEDVKETIVDPGWKPVGTEQTGEHAAVYDESSVDWKEMLRAISYATGIDEENMTIWFLGNNGGPNQAAGTVSEKGSDEKLRVAIEWVDNEGWKPVKVEVLK